MSSCECKLSIVIYHQTYISQLQDLFSHFLQVTCVHAKPDVVRVRGAWNTWNCVWPKDYVHARSIEFIFFAWNLCKTRTAAIFSESSFKKKTNNILFSTFHLNSCSFSLHISLTQFQNILLYLLTILVSKK